MNEDPQAYAHASEEVRDDREFAAVAIEKEWRYVYSNSELERIFRTSFFQASKSFQREFSEYVLHMQRFFTHIFFFQSLT